MYYNYQRFEDTNKRWAGGVLGTAVLLGLGGAGIAGGLGAFGKKKATAPDLKQIPTLSSTAEYPLYKSTLEDRIAGRGLGYDQSVLDSNTAPYAKQRMSSLKETELPAISADASARGLGRSTIPVNRSALATQAASRDIEERVAQLTLQNEQEKASEKTGAISQYGSLMGNDYNSLMNNINSQNQIAVSNNDVQNQNNAALNASRQQGYNDLAGLGLGTLSGGTSLSSLAPKSTANSYADVTSLNSSDWWDYISGRNKAAVNLPKQ